MTDQAADPRRYRIGEKYRRPAISGRGTVVVKAAKPWGFDAYFTSVTPCCFKGARFSAHDACWDATGHPVTCRGCGWKWYVHLAHDGERLTRLPDGTRHPHIRANQAEWESRGFGTRPYHRRKN